MARAPHDNPFLKQATKMGLEKMLFDVKQLLENDLTPAQRFANEEMRTQIEKYLEEMK